jgi:hypothetical protein
MCADPDAETCVRRDAAFLFSFSFSFLSLLILREELDNRRTCCCCPK